MPPGKKWYESITYMQIMCGGCRHLVSPKHDEVKQELSCPECRRIIYTYREGELEAQLPEFAQ